MKASLLPEAPITAAKRAHSEEAVWFPVVFTPREIREITPREIREILHRIPHKTCRYFVDIASTSVKPRQSNEPVQYSSLKTKKDMDEEQKEQLQMVSVAVLHYDDATTSVSYINNIAKPHHKFVPYDYQLYLMDAVNCTNNEGIKLYHSLANKMVEYEPNNLNMQIAKYISSLGSENNKNCKLYLQWLSVNRKNLLDPQLLNGNNGVYYIDNAVALCQTYRLPSIAEIEYFYFGLSDINKTPPTAGTGPNISIEIPILDDIVSLLENIIKFGYVNDSGINIQNVLYIWCYLSKMTENDVNGTTTITIHSSDNMVKDSIKINDMLKRKHFVYSSVNKANKFPVFEIDKSSSYKDPMVVTEANQMWYLNCIRKMKTQDETKATALLTCLQKNTAMIRINIDKVTAYCINYDTQKSLHLSVDNYYLQNIMIITLAAACALYVSPQEEQSLKATWDEYNKEIEQLMVAYEDSISNTTNQHQIYLNVLNAFGSNSTNYGSDISSNKFETPSILDSDANNSRLDQLLTIDNIGTAATMFMGLLLL